MIRPKTGIVAFVLAGIVLACVFSQSSCSGTKTTENKTTLRIATSFRIQSIDPLKSGSYFLVEFGVAELPLMLDDSGKLQPWLLESYARLDDLNWRLRVRPNVKFQNGQILTAEKFALAMNRQLSLSPATKTILPNATVKVENERELILTTGSPDPNVPAALADEAVFPIYDVEAAETAGHDQNQLVKSGCYTGAYSIVSLDERELQTTRNPTYWRGIPPLDAVSIRFVSDSQSRILAVQNDEADIALYPPTEAKRMLANRTDAFFITSEASNGGPTLFFNLRHAPFDDIAVRRAFSFGMNFDSLAKRVMDGICETADGFYPPALSWAIHNQKTDIAEANRLLDTAGWQIGGDGIRVKHGVTLESTLLVYPQQPDLVTLATAIQAQLRGIGINIKIRQVDGIDESLKDVNEWDAAIYSSGVVTTGGATARILQEYFMTSGENNFGGVSDVELDKLISQLDSTFDETDRTQLLKRIQEIVIAERAYIVRPVFTRARVVVGRRYRAYQPSMHLHHITFETKPNG